MLCVLLDIRTWARGRNPSTDTLHLVAVQVEHQRLQQQALSGPLVAYPAMLEAAKAPPSRAAKLTEVRPSPAKLAQAQPSPHP